MIRNEKMYNKLNSMTIDELRDYARRNSIKLSKTEKTKDQLVEAIMSSVHINFYKKCKRRGYNNVEDENQLKGIIEIAKDYDLQYDDIITVYRDSRDYHFVSCTRNLMKSRLLKIVSLIIIGGIILFVMLMFAKCVWGLGGQSKWSQLTPEEQDNARFAYEAQQAADDYRRDHPGR